MINFVPSKPEYAEFWFKWRSEANTKKYNPLANTSIKKLSEMLAKMGADLSDLKSAREFRFFIQLEDGDEIIGTITLKGINHMMQFAEIGYSIAQDFQGRGIGSLVVDKFIDKIMRETSLRRIIAYVAEDNIASCKVLEKAGFIKEGLCREHYIVNGKPKNEVLYGLLRSDIT